MIASQRSRWVAPTFALLLSWTTPGVAQKLDPLLAEVTDIEADARQLRESPLRRSQTLSPTHVEERLADGELYYRLGDYLRASVIFTDIVDHQKGHRAYPDALFLLAESLFQAGDHLGARTRLREILDHAGEAAFRPYVQQALSRLIEIAVQIRDFGGAEEYFARLNQLPTTELEAATAYYRAKYLYGVAVRDADDEHGDVVAGRVVQTKLEEARAAFEAVPETSPYRAQARYFLGVIYTLRAQLAQAGDAFAGALRPPADTPEQRSVRELAQLALGRIHYETDALDRAVEAYEAVPRDSPHFDAALYEIAWVHVRRGDAVRAERALEVLAVAMPQSRFVPDGQLLRANLLLRDGRFDDAAALFERTVAEFAPVRDDIDRIVAEHEDPAAYFRAAVRDNLEAFDVGKFLPHAALRWARIEGDMERALAALADLSTARRLVRESEDLSSRLTNALRVDNPVNLFRDLRGHRERVVALENRIARVRRDLAGIEEAATEDLQSEELSTVRASRRELERRLGGIPTDSDDLRRRSSNAKRRYRELEKELSVFEVQLIGLEARIVAIERFVAETPAGRSADATEALGKELEGHRGVITRVRAAMRETARDLEAARLRVGVDDADFARDEELRKQHGALLTRERALLARLGVKFDGRIDAALARLLRAEELLAEHDREIAAAVAERVDEIRRVLDEERTKLALYRDRLVPLGDDAEIVIGDITWRNFRRIRQRFYDLVLQSDLGIVDVAWAKREEHRTRAEMLTRERARALQALDDEFHDMLDEEASR